MLGLQTAVIKAFASALVGGLHWLALASPEKAPQPKRPTLSLCGAAATPNLWTAIMMTTTTEDNGRPTSEEDEDNEDEKDEDEYEYE